MRKRYHAAAIGTYILIILAGVIWHAGGVSAEDTIKLTVNSHTTSKAVMDNMQPGDMMTSEYTVINDGNERFDYFVDFEFGSGDEDLFKILQMTLQKEGVTLYSGAMSEALGRVAIGSLAGGGREVIRMDVTFPLAAGNEYQGKTTSVNFGFSASASPGPSAEPSATPAAASPNPTAGPSATASPGPSDSPGATPSATPTAGNTSVPGGINTPGASASPSAAPAVTAYPGADEVTITEAPVPLGDTDNKAAPSPGAKGSGSVGTATPSPDNEVDIDDEELPLSPPDGGDKLPDTAEPWYNLILISMAIAVLSVILLRRLNSKK